MLLRHKLKSGSMVELISEYIEMFSSVASLVFDLGPYLMYLKNTPDAQKLTNQLQGYVDEQKDPMRKTRLLLNLRKLE